MKSKALISVAIITKNEEDDLPDCLKSVSFADDIVVVDSGSSDRTVEIARDFGCRVFVEEWKKDGPQKNSAVQKCRYDWVLILDADERIPKETQKMILEIMKNPTADAYSFPRKNFFHEKWIRHSGWWPDETVRFVKKTKGSFYHLTHGIWKTNGKIEKLDAPIEHYSFKNYSDMLKILESRTTDMAKELFDSGKRVNVLTPLLHGIAMFIKSYILKFGFLSGLDGLVVAITRAGGTFFKYAKLLELQRYSPENKEKR